MTKIVCDICGKEMPNLTKLGVDIRNVNFCCSSYGRIWDICTECREDLNRWMTTRKQERNGKE